MIFPRHIITGSLFVLFLFHSGVSSAQNDFFNGLADRVTKGAGELLDNPEIMNAPLAGKIMNDVCDNEYCKMAMGLVGAEIIRQLSARDKSMHQNAINQAVSTGESQTWSNSETGNSGSVVVRPLPSKRTTREIQTPKGRLEAIPPLDEIEEVYVAKSEANVRGGPGTDFVIVDKLQSQEAVKVFGKVKGQNWYLIGEDDVAVGYVSASLLTKASANVPVKPIAPKVEPEELQTAEVNYDLECRQTEVDVVLASGEEGKGTATYCNGPQGWYEV